MNGMAQIEALESAVEFGAQAVEANKIGFRIGTRINPDVLNAEQQLYSAARDLMKARVDVVMQGLKLKAAAGIMQEQDLAALDALFEVPAKLASTPTPLMAAVPATVLPPVPATAPQATSLTSPIVFAAAPAPAKPLPAVSLPAAPRAAVVQAPVSVSTPAPTKSGNTSATTWLVKTHGRIVRAAPDSTSELLMRLGADSVVARGTEPAYPPRFEYWRHVVVGNVKGWMASDALEPSQLPPKTVTYP
jgi:predicted component of type VI protein secretion system